MLTLIKDYMGHVQDLCDVIKLDISDPEPIRVERLHSLTHSTYFITLQPVQARILP